VSHGRRVIDETIIRHVANEEQPLSVLTIADQEKLSSLLRKLTTGLWRRSIGHGHLRSKPRRYRQDNYHRRCSGG
jgi:hypothetical protein